LQAAGDRGAAWARVVARREARTISDFMGLSFERGVVCCLGPYRPPKQGERFFVLKVLLKILLFVKSSAAMKKTVADKKIFEFRDYKLCLNFLLEISEIHDRGQRSA